MIVSDSPSTRVNSVLERVMEVTAIILGATETAHVAVKPPSSDFAVIVVDPGESAETLPLLTLATDPLLLDQMTALLSASLGEMVAVKSAVSPSIKESDEEFNVIPVTLIGWGSL